MYSTIGKILTSQKPIEIEGVDENVKYPSDWKEMIQDIEPGIETEPELMDDEIPDEVEPETAEDEKKKDTEEKKEEKEEKTEEDEDMQERESLEDAKRLMKRPALCRGVRRLKLRDSNSTAQPLDETNELARGGRSLHLSLWYVL